MSSPCVTSTPPCPALPCPARPAQPDARASCFAPRYFPLARVSSRAELKMDAATTNKLVNNIIGTWPAGPKAHVWTQVVASLDPAPASQAWRNLARTEQKITVAQFVAEHSRLVLAADHSAPLADCIHCEHGWRVVHEEHGGHIYDACEPCSCPAGQVHVDTHQRILDDNRIELNRVIPGRAERAVFEQQQAEF